MMALSVLREVEQKLRQNRQYSAAEMLASTIKDIKDELITDEEILALRAVIYGCNINSRLTISSYLRNAGQEDEQRMEFTEAVRIAHDLVVRLEGDSDENNQVRQG